MAHSPGSTRSTLPWKSTLAAVAGACLMMTAMGPAHAADDGLAELPPAEQAQVLEEAGVDQSDLERDRALKQLSETTDTDFYATPAQLPANNGDLVRQEPAKFYLDPVKLIQPNAKATRIMYRTTSSHGQAVGTTGTVLASNAAWPKKGPRPLVVFSPGTQGMADRCAPSRQMALGMEYEGLSLTGLINAGYSVVVPDYIGLGTEGPHTYMNRVDQAHAVLDAGRAAQRAGIPGIAAETPVAMVGYSQGGGATASAAETAPTYAPELKIKTAWAGAPPADLPATGKHIDSTLFSGLAFYVMGAATEAGADARGELNEDGLARYEKAQESCVINAVLDHALVPTSSLTKDGSTFTQLLGQPELAGYLAQQTNGTEGRRPAVPVRIAHGPADDVVPYRAGRELAQRWCAAGTNVSFQTLVTPTHLGGYLEGVPAMLTHLDARFNGLPQVSSCWRL